MNLYIFNETRRGSVYGVGTYIRELTATLKDSGINICVINLTSEKPQIQTEEIDGIKYWYFPSALTDQRMSSNQKQWENYYRNIVYLLRLHIKDNKDLIFHLNFCQGVALAEELKNAFDCRIVSVIHFTDWGFTVYDNPERLRNILREEHPDNFGENLKKKFEEEKVLYLKADHTICMSNYMKEILCRDYGLDANKITIVPNGIDNYELKITNYEQETGRGVTLREKWHIPAGEKIILFAGRIDEVKGVVYLIRAFREVLKKHQGCRLIIAGGGNYDLCLRETKDISTKITFTGLLEKQELHEIYQIADIGVVPSLYEPFGYVAIEMMMHGLPVVATATSGLNEVVDETCGLKVPLVVSQDKIEIDTDLLADKILYLLQNPLVAKKMGRNGRKRYIKEYSLEVFRKNMLKLYHSLYAYDT